MLTHRPLTENEARTLHEELKTTPNIIGYTIKELTSFGDVFVWEEDGRLAGACFSKDLRFGWTDIAVLYVLPPFRGRRIGKQLFDAAWARATERGRHIVALSRSPEVISWMRKHGMTLTQAIWKAPLAMHLHMNCHMNSLYRTREVLRKARQLKTIEKLHLGTRTRDS